MRLHTQSAKQLDATLERLTEAAMIRVRDSQIYIGLADRGQSVFDDHSSAVRAHRDDWTPLLNWLEKRAAEPRQRGNVTPLLTPAQRLGN